MNRRKFFSLIPMLPFIGVAQTQSESIQEYSLKELNSKVSELTAQHEQAWREFYAKEITKREGDAKRADAILKIMDETRVEGYHYFHAGDVII